MQFCMPMDTFKPLPKEIRPGLITNFAMFGISSFFAYFAYQVILQAWS